MAFMAENQKIDMKLRRNVVFCLICVAFVVFSGTSMATSNSVKTVRTEIYPECALNPESIIHLTMEHSARIQAARHQLESAEYNFKLFESRYTQFSPLKMGSKIERDQNSEYESELTVGIEKEYFDGSSVSAGVGTRETWGKDVDEDSGQFFRTRIQFPLFSSNRKLTRMIQRTFEENELYSSQLDYVNTIRGTIRNSLREYYDYIPRVQTLERLRAYKKDLVAFRNCEALSDRSDDCQLLDGEINLLTSRIQGWEIKVESLLIGIERWIGVPECEKYTVDSIDLDFKKMDYFGEFYVSAPYDEIYKRTIENDTELMVLKLIKINAIEKKHLAHEGKWDIFLTTEGKYNFNEHSDHISQDNYYEVSSGLTVKRFDKWVLRYTIQKADADIFYIDEKMKDRRLAMAADIRQKKVALLTTKKQVLSSRKSFESWEEIHRLKRESFLQETATTEDYLQSFRSMVNAMADRLDYENEYFDTIRDFDYICGTYFKALGINVAQLTNNGE